MQWLFCPESQRLSFPIQSVGIAQAWSHCWTYLLDEGGGTRGGSNSVQYK